MHLFEANLSSKTRHSSVRHSQLKAATVHDLSPSRMFLRNTLEFEVAIADQGRVEICIRYSIIVAR